MSSLHVLFVISTFVAVANCSVCQKALAAQEALWTQRKNRRLSQNDTLFNRDPKLAYDLFEQEWICATDIRVGAWFSDGGKFVCGLQLLSSLRHCIVYSIGSAGYDEFELELANTTMCEVHTFDPTMDVGKMKARANIGRYTYHDIGLSQTNSLDGRYLTLDSIMHKLSHNQRHINVLKIDCEGCELEALPHIFSLVRSGAVVIDQILVEIHGTDYGRIKNIFENADAAKYVISHKERNHWGCGGIKCVEYAFLSRKFAVSEFLSSHCCKGSFHGRCLSKSSGLIDLKGFEIA